MERLIDASIWIDFLRSRTPRPVREQARAILDSPDAAICEPLEFELMRSAAPAERAGLQRRLSTMSRLDLPRDFWRSGSLLGQRCRDAGFTVGSLDLLIAVVALAHGAEIVTFDGDYAAIAQAEPRLQVKVVVR